MKLFVLAVLLMATQAWALQSPKAASLTAIPPPSNTVVAQDYSALAIASPPNLQNGIVRLRWEPSSDPSVTDYRIYFSEISSNSSAFQSVGMVTNAVIGGLQFGRTYRFTATALAGVVESPPSNVVTSTVPFKTSIRVERMAIESPGGFGITNLFQMSTNLKNWQTVKTFVGNGTNATYLHTNGLTGTFFKVIPK